MKIRTDEHTDSGNVVNLTPLIDIVFLLLIFFVVTAQFQEDERDLAVTLPDAQSAEEIRDLPETLFVGVRRDGTYTVGQEPADLDGIARLLRRAKRQNPRQKVVIRADREVALHHPVAILDLCAGLGIEHSLGIVGAGER